MRVADLMQKDVQTIAPDAPIAELVQMLADYHVSGLPVVTASGKVLGVVTATDVLQASADVNDPETWSQRLENMAVQDLMTSQPHMIGPDAPEILQLAAVAVKAGLTKRQFDACVAIHPTMAEEMVLLK